MLQQLPKAVGLPASANCAQMVISALKDMEAYTRCLTEGMKHVLRQRLGAPNGQSVKGMMTVYVQRQSASKLNHSYTGPTASMLNIFRSQENHSDTEWMNLLAVALTGLPVEDWSDRQVEEFSNALDAALQEVESVPADGGTEGKASVRLSLGGITLEQSLPETELDGLSSVAYESVRSALHEFGDSLTPDEKILILANLMLHVNA